MIEVVEEQSGPVVVFFSETEKHFDEQVVPNSWSWMLFLFIAQMTTVSNNVAVLICFLSLRPCSHVVICKFFVTVVLREVNYINYVLIFLLPRTLDVTLDLKDPQYPEHNLGTLDLSVTLSPKEVDLRDAVRNLYDHSDV